MKIGGLFLGLGNPGAAYANTRHNFGFMVADALLEACRNGGDITPLSGGKNRYDAWKCRLPIASSPIWIVAKPLTFMNKSGEAAVPLMQFYRIPPSSLIVAHDDMDLPLGRIRFKSGGGAAGHNGVRSIAECLGTPDFFRLRLGIGKPTVGDATSFVLGRFAEPEVAILREITTATLAGFFRFCGDGFKEAQQFVNGFTIFSS